MDREEPKARSGALSPLAAFAVLVLVVVAGGAYLLTGSEDDTPLPAPAPQATPSPTSHRLTDAQAKARFKELDALRIRALEQRSLRLLSQAAMTESPIGKRVRQTILDLRKNQVTVDEQWLIRDVAVVENGLAFIKLRVVGTSDAQFFDEDGNEVTQQARKEKRTVNCDLRFEASDWLLWECEVEKVVSLESAQS